MIEVVPTWCEGCIHNEPRVDGDVIIFDYCYVYDCEITDEVMDKCKFYCKKEGKK